MGLDYSYDLFLTRGDLVNLARELGQELRFDADPAEMSNVPGKLRTIRGYSGYSTLPDGVLAVEKGVDKIGLAVSILFEPDDFTRADDPEGEWEVQDQTNIGGLEVKVDRLATSLDGCVRLNARAVTNGQSRVLESSPSVRKRLLEISEDHNAVACVLNLEGNGIVIWLDGKEENQPIDEYGGGYGSCSECTVWVRWKTLSAPIRELFELENVADKRSWLESIARDETEEIQRAVALGMYAEYGAPDLSLLRAALQDAGMYVRAEAGRVIGSLPKPELDLLTNALRDEHYHVRRMVCYELNGTALPSLVPELVAIFAGNDPLATWYIRRVVQQKADENTAHALIGIVRNAYEPRMRDVARQILAYCPQKVLNSFRSELNILKHQ